jgi:ankyrin repeat protein
LRAPLGVLEALLRTDPTTASLKNNSGNLPLHLAVMNQRALVKVVEALLSAYPLASSEKNNEGDLPLHIAVKSKTQDSEVVKALIRANPNDASTHDSEGKLPSALTSNMRKDIRGVLLTAEGTATLDASESVSAPN